jgi:hypothetical protein
VVPLVQQGVEFDDGIVVAPIASMRAREPVWPFSLSGGA